MNTEKITPSTAPQASHIYASSWEIGYQEIIPRQYLDELSTENRTPTLEKSDYESTEIDLTEKNYGQ